VVAEFKIHTIGAIIVDFVKLSPVAREFICPIVLPLASGKNMVK